jgi:thioesterase domain-containing protein/acyl carrier protein
MPAREGVEQELAEIWESSLQVKSVGITDNFFDLGGDSLTAVRVFSRIEAVFGKTLSIATLFHSPTIKALADRILEQFVASESSCLVEIQRGDGGMPIFCVHGGGGNVVGFRDLARLLGADQPVYGIQARGLYDDRPPDTSVEEMAAHYVALVRVAWPRGPYALAGFSFGGVVAFEMARQLTASGARVTLLALLDTPALGSYRLLPKAMHLRRMSSLLGRRITYHTRNLVRLRRREKIDYLAARSRTLKRKMRSRLWQMQFRAYSTLGRFRSPSVLRTAEVLPDRFRNVAESLTLAARQYTPQPYAGQATLFRARDTPAIFLVDPTLGWSELVEHLQIREVPGDHATLLREPHLPALAGELKTCLEEARNAARDA